MDRFTEQVIAAARRRGANYCDCRLIELEREEIAVMNGALRALTQASQRGFGVRVIVDGAWGFSSSSVTSDGEIDRIVDEAVLIARASASVKKRDVVLAPTGVYEDLVPHQAARDPFTVPDGLKVELLVEATRAMQIPGVVMARGQMQFSRERKTFASSEGSYIIQDRIESGAGIKAIAADDKGGVQVRSYPMSLSGDSAQAGWEFVEAMDLVTHAEPTAREAVALLTAKPCPSGVKDLVVGGQQMALQIHESCGHPTELDRVMGMEASFAGTSFLTTDKKGTFQYGSPHVNLTADPTIPHALGGLVYDDEGVRGRKVYLVQNGIFKHYLNSRASAPVVGEEPMGAMRADGFSRCPIVRMVSINIEPGMASFDELVGGIDDGILVDGIKSWSIDDRRLNFQFGSEIGWEIRGGKLQEMLRNPTYTGIAYEFWRSCDAVGDASQYHVWGVDNCGKGEPMQVAHVSHGTSPARFRQVRVGVLDE
ncbi:MAG: TldD/PmbA family protein [Caldisericota bacterium]|nr:TldD/PmbA family protein [Caldisericota bacterium]